MSVRGTLIIHHFRGNKRGFVAEVTFRASIQQKVIDSSCGKPRRTSSGPVGPLMMMMMMSVKKSRPTKSENGARLTSTIHIWEPERISLPRFRWWQGLINVMSMSALWGIILAAGCGPLLRVDDSLPGFTYIKGDPSLNIARHSSPYFRASTGNHPAALDRTDKTWGLSWVPSIGGGPLKISLTGENLITCSRLFCEQFDYHQTDLLVAKLNCRWYSLSLISSVLRLRLPGQIPYWGGDTSKMFRIITYKIDISFFYRSFYSHSAPSRPQNRPIRLTTSVYSDQTEKSWTRRR